jgi:hypothetical protein
MKTLAGLVVVFVAARECRGVEIILGSIGAPFPIESHEEGLLWLETPGGRVESLVQAPLAELGYEFVALDAGFAAVAADLTNGIPEPIRLGYFQHFYEVENEKGISLQPIGTDFHRFRVTRISIQFLELVELDVGQRAVFAYSLYGQRLPEPDALVLLLSAVLCALRYRTPVR